MSDETVGLLTIQTYLYKKRHRGGAVTWVVRWRSPVTGKWRAVAGGKTKAEAMLFEAKVRNELAKGNDPQLLKMGAVAELTISALIDEFYEHSRFLGSSEGWRVENRRRLEQYVRAYLGSIPYSELTVDSVLKHYIGFRDLGRSRATIHKVHTLMCILGDLYLEFRPGAVNVARRVPFGKYFPKRAPKREINFLTPEELEVLYGGCSRARQRLLLPLVKFLTNTGLRRSEALNLKWTDIDQANGFIQVRESKTGRSRNIPIETAAWDAISHLQGRGLYVFTYRDGSRPDKASFREPLKLAAKKVGIKKRIDLHTLRHSYGSNKIRAGFGLKKVSMLLGHSDIQMTAGVYTHLLDGDLRLPDYEARVFDKASNQLNSGEKVNGTERAPQAVLESLGDLLKRQPEVLERIEGELNRIIAAAKTVNTTEADESGSKRNEIPETQPKGDRAPLLLRSLKKD